MARTQVDPAQSSPESAPVDADSSVAEDDRAQDAAQHIDDVFKDLKTLLSTVEKLQKARQDVSDLKPLILRLLDGELLSGEELEELRSNLNQLAKLVRLYGDYQIALDRAQPARQFLDEIIKS